MRLRPLSLVSCLPVSFPSCPFFFIFLFQNSSQAFTNCSLHLLVLYNKNVICLKKELELLARVTSSHSCLQPKVESHRRCHAEPHCEFLSPFPRPSVPLHPHLPPLLPAKPPLPLCLPFPTHACTPSLTAPARHVERDYFTITILCFICTSLLSCWATLVLGPACVSVTMTVMKVTAFSKYEK